MSKDLFCVTLTQHITMSGQIKGVRLSELVACGKHQDFFIYGFFQSGSAIGNADRVCLAKYQ
jgi:hypothetical protein